MKAKIYLPYILICASKDSMNNTNQLYQNRFINKNIGVASYRLDKNGLLFTKRFHMIEWDYWLFLGKNDYEQYFAS